MVSLEQIFPKDRQCVAAALVLALALGSCSSGSNAPRRGVALKAPVATAPVTAAQSAAPTQPNAPTQRPKPSTEDVLAKLEVASAADLDQARGGFTINGFDFSIAASIVTMITEANGQFSKLSSRLSLPKAGQAVLETVSQTSTPSGVVTTVSETTPVTAQQVADVIKSIDVKLATAETVIRQKGFETNISNKANNAAISHAVELAIDVQNFKERFQSMRQDIRANAMAARMRALSLRQ